jgi:Leucine-rich repeat (LRR) protein
LLTDVGSLLSKLNPEKIREFDLSNNRFGDDLNIFSKKFVNLENLDISNNHFTNSLEPLQDLTKLKELNITNTDIKSGLEYLPDSLETLQCYDPDFERDSFKSNELYKTELHSFNGSLKT